MQRKSVVGTRSSLLWLLILGIVVLLTGAIVGALIILPQMQASRTEQARLAEIERRYKAGVAFERVEDWASAEGEYRQVIVLDAGYKDVSERLSKVRGRLSAIQATATASALAEATRATMQARATAEAAPTATADALDARYRRAVGLVNMGQWPEAQVELRGVFDVAPDYRDVQRLLPTVNAEVSKLTPSGTPTPRFATVEVAGGKPATAHPTSTAVSPTDAPRPRATAVPPMASNASRPPTSTPFTSSTPTVVSVLRDGDIVALKCLGDIEGPRWLDGRTGDGTVGLAPQLGGGYTGTKWRVTEVGNNVIALECLGHIEGSRWLDGRTGDGTVGLAPQTSGYTGTRWEVVHLELK